MSTDSTTLPRPEELRPAVELARRLLEQLDAMLLGRPELHRLVLAAVLVGSLLAVPIRTASGR